MDKFSLTNSKDSQKKLTDILKKRERLYKCNICFKIFNSLNNLFCHKKSHLKTFDCEYCEQKFNEKFHLVEHTRIHTGERPHKCTKCDKTFTRLSTLYVHNNTECINFFECEVCKKKFIRKDHLISHQQRHEDEKSGDSNLCKKTSNKSEGTEQRKKRSREDRSEVRPKKKIMLENELESNLVDPDLEKINKIDNLTKIHEQESSSHFLKIYNVKSCDCVECEAAKNPQNDDNKNLPSKIACCCEFCKKTFASKNYLKVHLEKHCKVFKKLSKIKESSVSIKRCDNLIKKILPNPETRPARDEYLELDMDELFKCHYCCKKYQDKLSLNRHIKRKHFFSCEHCVKIFTHKKDYKLHVKTHPKKLRIKQDISIQKHLRIDTKKLLASSTISINSEKDQIINTLMNKNKISNKNFQSKLKEPTVITISDDIFDNYKSTSIHTSNSIIIDDSEDDCIIEEPISRNAISSEKIDRVNSEKIEDNNLKLNFESGKSKNDEDNLQFQIIESTVASPPKNSIFNEMNASMSKTTSNSTHKDDSDDICMFEELISSNVISSTEEFCFREKYQIIEARPSTSSTMENILYSEDISSSSKISNNSSDINNFDNVDDNDDIHVVKQPSSSDASRDVKRIEINEEKCALPEVMMTKEIDEESKMKNENCATKKEDKNLASIVKNLMKNEISQVMDNVCSNLKNEVLKILE